MCSILNNIQSALNLDHTPSLSCYGTRPEESGQFMEEQDTAVSRRKPGLTASSVVENDKSLNVRLQNTSETIRKAETVSTAKDTTTVEQKSAIYDQGVASTTTEHRAHTVFDVHYTQAEVQSPSVRMRFQEDKRGQVYHSPDIVCLHCIH